MRFGTFKSMFEKSFIECPLSITGNSHNKTYNMEAQYINQTHSMICYPKYLLPQNRLPARKIGNKSAPGRKTVPSNGSVLQNI